MACTVFLYANGAIPPVKWHVFMATMLLQKSSSRTSRHRNVPLDEILLNFNPAFPSILNTIC